MNVMSKVLRYFDKSLVDQRKYIDIIRSSNIFEPTWYCDRYKKFKIEKENSIKHYVTRGAGMGLNPSPLFDTNFYLRMNPDVRASGINPLLHYILHGWREYRDPCALFDVSYVINTYEQFRKQNVEPLAYYKYNYRSEKLSPHPLFDAPWYIKFYEDIAQSGSEPLSHYLEYGWRERRRPNEIFDVDWYLRQLGKFNEQVVENALIHYITEGKYRNISFNALIDDRKIKKDFKLGSRSAMEQYIHHIEDRSQYSFNGRSNWSPYDFEKSQFFLQYVADLANGGM